MVTIPKKVLLSLVASSALLSPALYAKSETNLVQSIMKLRADVESLYTTIDDNKDAYKSQMKSYTMQIADNEAQINRQETSLKLTKQEVEKSKTKLASIGKGEDIKPMINTAILKLSNEIKAGIPFKTEDRLAALEKIQSDLKEGSITQDKALALVWASYDDAIRMTKEIGQFKQKIMLDGEPTLAKVAKIGSVMMFFSTPDNKVGYVKKEQDKYTYKVTTDESERAQIVALFDALQKQIRTGYFTLPNALALRGVK